MRKRRDKRTRDLIKSAKADWIEANRVRAEANTFTRYDRIRSSADVANLKVNSYYGFSEAHPRLRPDGPPAPRSSASDPKWEAKRADAAAKAYRDTLK